jgi:PAS domain S-box-containing protein
MQGESNSKSGGKFGWLSQDRLLNWSAAALLVFAAITIKIVGVASYNATQERVVSELQHHVQEHAEVLTALVEREAEAGRPVTRENLGEIWGELTDFPAEHDIWASGFDSIIFYHSTRPELVGHNVMELGIATEHSNRTEDGIVANDRAGARSIWTGWLGGDDGGQVSAVSYLGPLRAHMGVSIPMAESRAAIWAQYRPWLAAMIAIGIGVIPGVLLLHRMTYQRAVRAVQRVEAEQASMRQDAEKRIDEMALFFENATVGFSLLDPELRYMRINRALARHIGTTPDELIGRELLPNAPETEKIVRPLLEKVRDSGEPITGLILAAPDPANQSQVREWNLSYHPLYDRDGTVRAIGTVVQDVTDLGRAWRQLELIADSTGAVLYSHTTNPAAVTYMSPSVEKVWGVSRESLLADPNLWSSSVVEEDRAIVRDEKDEWLDDGAASALEQEYRVLRPDGSIGWVRDTRVAIRDETGRIGEVLGVAIDITDVRRSRDALRLILEGTTSTGKEFFDALVLSLGRAMGAKWVFLGRSSDGLRMRSLARCVEGQLTEQTTYDLAGTPCERACRDKRQCFYRHSVQEQFPEDDALRELGVESYLGTPLISSSGEVIGLLVVMHDEPIDESTNPESVLRIFASRAASELERQEMVQRLSESESKLREAQRVARLGNFDWDVITGEMTWSDGVYELFDIPENGAPPSIDRLFQSVPEEHHERLKRQFRDAIEHGSEYSFDHPVHLRDGRIRHVHAQGRIYRNEEGAAVRIVGTALDITERKSAESVLQRAHDMLEERVVERTRALVEASEAVQRSEQRLRAMFDNSGAGVLLTDASGRITQANPAMLDMLLQHLGDVLGVTLTSLVHADDCASAERDTADVLSGARDSAQHEIRLRRADGQHVWTRITCSRMPERSGEPSGLVAIVENVTERKLAEEEARERQDELAHISRYIAVGELAAGLAHELNQPLAAVSAYADTCARRLRNGGADAETIETVEKIGEQSRRAGEIVHRLKNLVRKRQPQRERFDLVKVLDESAALLSVEARSRGLRVRLEVDESEISIDGDPVQVQQVAINLIKNAIDATPPGAPNGDFPGSTRDVIVRAQRDPELGILISVRNWNGGSEEKLPEEIFDLFYSTRPQGMGLGLPISRSIIEAHGGRLWTHSESDTTWFSFSLPVRNGVQHDAVGTSGVHR